MARLVINLIFTVFSCLFSVNLFCFASPIAPSVLFTAFPNRTMIPMKPMTKKTTKNASLAEASMRTQRHFNLGYGDPLPALMKGASAYHLGFFESDAVRLWHTQYGEDKSASNQTETWTLAKM